MSIPTPSSEGFDELTVPLVKDLMTSPIITANPKTNLIEAVKIMNDHRIGSLVAVIDGKPVGIVTERDIMTKVVGRTLNALDLNIADVMSTPVRTIEEDATLEAATRLMVKYGVRRLPVVNKNGDLIGIITSTDMVREFPDTINQLTKRVRLR